MAEGVELPNEIKYLNPQDVHDKYSDIRSNDSGDSDDDTAAPSLPHTDHPDQLINDVKPPTFRNAGNTGVKGVLADYAEAKEKMMLRTLQERAEAQKRIEKMAITVGNPPNANNLEEEDDEDEELRQIRAKRLAELQNQRPTFGYMRQIDSSEFLEVIDKEHKDVFVAIHLFKNEFKSCVKLNLILQNLAIKYPFVKFLKIKSTEANPNFDDIGLPALIVYKGGDIFANFTPITTKIGNDFDAEDVELLLAKYKIIKIADKTQMFHKQKTAEFIREFDDDFSDDEEED